MHFCTVSQNFVALFKITVSHWAILSADISINPAKATENYTDKEKARKNAAPKKRNGVVCHISEQRRKKPHYPALELCKKALFFYAIISYSFAL